jgi:hypothetical protein
MNKLFLILGIGIVVTFGLLLAGYYAYEPLWYNYYKSRLMSDDREVVKYAAKTIAAEGERAVPYLRKWLDTADTKLVTASYQILSDFPDKEWKKRHPDLANGLFIHKLKCQTIGLVADNVNLEQIPTLFSEIADFDISIDPGIYDYFDYNYKPVINIDENKITLFNLFNKIAASFGFLAVQIKDEKVIFTLDKDKVERIERFFQAVEKGDRTEAEKYLNAGVDPNIGLSSRNKAIFFAIKNRDLKMLDLLLEKKSNINTVTGFGQTPLAAAVDCGCPDEMCVYLINMGADLNAGDVPPIFWAAASGNKRLCALLLQKGANPNIVNKTLRATALDKAHDEEIRKLLREHGAKTAAELNAEREK